jgi:lysophospholipase L1-like esterase
MLSRARASAALFLLTTIAATSALTACTLGEDAPAIPGGEASNEGDIIGAPSAPAASTNGQGKPAGVDPNPAPEPELVVRSLANLGDSISQGFDADDGKPLDLSAVIGGDGGAVFHDNPALSWVQGTDARVGSIASHYRALDPNLVLTPLSRSGAELVGKNSGLPNLEKQARSIATKGVSPDLVYVLLGGNDVCNRPRSTTNDATATMYSVDEWRAAAARGLTALSEVLSPGATVRFVSMPRVDLLYDALGGATVPVLVSSPRTVTRASARSSRPNRRPRRGRPSVSASTPTTPRSPKRSAASTSTRRRTRRRSPSSPTGTARSTPAGSRMHPAVRSSTSRST